MLCCLPIARGEALMDAFDALAGPDLHSLDPSGGVLVVTTYWRPRSGDPNPEQPGEKLSILSYLPTDADELCPCGSGNSFGACASLCHICDQFAQIQACRAIVWCIRNQLASRRSPPKLCTHSCRMMSGSIALRIRRSGRSGPIGETLRLILLPLGPCASETSNCKRTTPCPSAGSVMLAWKCCWTC